MKKVLVLIIALVAMLAIPIVTRSVPKAVSDTIQLDCSIPSPTGMYDEMCGPEVGQTQELPVPECLDSADNVSSINSVAYGSGASSCLHGHPSIYISVSLWYAPCDSHTGKDCPVYLDSGPNNPKAQTCKNSKYCSRLASADLKELCYYYWTHTYSDIPGTYPEKLRLWSSIGKKLCH